MTGVLQIFNRQRTVRLHTPLLRQITRSVLQELPGVENFELGLHLVGTAEMARINLQFLNHTGSTDVITFDYSESSTLKPQLSTPLHGEIYVCLDDAVAQARKFRTTWPSELARYVIHGLLHLRGHDDLVPAARRRMKREENRLLREVARQFPISKLARRSAAN